MKIRMSKDWPTRIAAGVAVVFGVLTILSGGRALFGGAVAQASAGDAVPFVLWFNFLSGFVYVLAGMGIAMGQRWAAPLAIAVTVAIASVFAAFGLHVFQGGAFEMRTVGAMTLRLVVWIVISVVTAKSSSRGDSSRTEPR